MLRAARAFARKEKLPVVPPTAPFRQLSRPRLIARIGAPRLDLGFDLLVAGEAEPRLRALLASFHPAARVHVSSIHRPEPSDFAAASYVTLWGGGLRDRFTDVEDAAFVDGRPCRCGGVDKIQVADLAVSRRYVRFDVATLASGGIVVSRRVVAMLGRKRFTGYVMRQVLDVETSKPLPMVQLVATTSILTPCLVHDRSDTTFCKGCGRGIAGNNRDGMTVRVSGARLDVIARHPHRHAYLYVSARLRGALVAMRAKGLAKPSDFINVCEHRARVRGS